MPKRHLGVRSRPAALSFTFKQLQENCDDLAGRIAACASELVRGAKRLHMDKVTLDDDEVFLSASAREVQHYVVKGSKRMGNNQEENTVSDGPPSEIASRSEQRPKPLIVCYERLY